MSPIVVLVLTDIWPDSALEAFKAAHPSPDYDVRYFPSKDTWDSSEDGPTEQDLKEAHVFIGFALPKTLTSYEQTPNLKLFQLCSAGTNHVESHPFIKSLPSDHPLILASSSGIHVSTIAEHVIGTVLSLFHGFQRFAIAQTKAQWIGNAELVGQGFAIRELRGQTMGVLGYGHIGRETARMAKALGMKVVVATRSGKKSSVGGYLIEGTGDINGDIPSTWFQTSSSSSMHDFYSTSDVVVNTLPSSSHTQKYVGESAFKSMKNDSIFVNIGRGDTVDQDVLISALEAGAEKGAGTEGDLRIGSAALDVTTPEPLPKESKLWSLPNVLLTPHMSGLSGLYFNRALDVAKQNIQRVFVEDKGALNAVRGKGE